MQCPPTPGPGVKILTLGCLFAIRIISYTSILSDLQIFANSFAYAMLISLNVFSTTFVISAVLISVNTSSASQKVAYTSLTFCAASALSAPIVLELCFSSYNILPGIILSGACTKLISLFSPAPLSSITGRTYLSIVPGETVDSIITIAPFSQTSRTFSTALTTYCAFTFLLAAS